MKIESVIKVKGQFESISREKEYPELRRKTSEQLFSKILTVIINEKNGILCLLLLTLLPVCLLAKPTRGYSIVGKLEGLKDGAKVWLKVLPDQKKPFLVDSTIVKDGKFFFHGYLNEGPMFAAISFFWGTKFVGKYLYLDNTDFQVSGQLLGISDPDQSISVFGSRFMDDVNSIGAAVSIFDYQDHLLYGYTSNGYLDNLVDSIGYNQKLMDGIMTGKEIFKKSLLEMLKMQYWKNQQAMAIIFSLYHQAIGFDSFWPDYYKTFSESIRNSYYGKLMARKLAFCIGENAPEFSSTTPFGKPLSLKEVESKSKIIIVDFWASWCAYCRNEGRKYLIPLYSKYHQKGLDIIGVSLDDDADLWKKAISEDHYPWLQVSSLKGHGEPISKLFDAHTPGNVLISGDGKIIAWNVFNALELEWYINKYTLK